MNHLSDEQLSALLDDALAPGERAACDAHLAGCDACRARLAEVSALDESLGKALTHDPGEGYFADFAERVAKRIDARALGASGAASSRRGPWGWLTSPRGLALAGSTAALLVTAGVAWMRFHNEQEVTRALREAAPVAPQSTMQSAPSTNDEVSPAPAPPVAEPPSSAERTRTDAASPRDLARAQEVRTLPNGEQVPVQRKQAPAGAFAAPPATGSTLAQMKKRSVAPATEGGAPAAAGTLKTESAPREDAQASKDAEARAPQVSNFAAPAPAAAPPAAAKLAEEPAAVHQKSALDTSRGRSMSTWGSTKALYGGTADARRLTGAVATCGRVRDSRGNAIAGAQVTALHDGVRTARTDTEGAFCIPGLAAGDTLTVMHVGFDPWTVVVTPMTSLAIELQPVGTLGPNATMLTGKPQSSPTFSGALQAHGITSADTTHEPRPDVYADLSSGIRQLVRDARDATAIAQREHTAPAFENAARQWAAVVGQVKGAPADDARFQYVSALRTAYQLQPTSERQGRLGKAIDAFLALAPATLPERATVARWKADLNGR